MRRPGARAVGAAALVAPVLISAPALFSASALISAPAQTDGPIVVASKPFAESYLLAETFAKLLESRGYPVDRRLGLGATEVALGALVRGDIDLYPEYTGTGLAVLGGELAGTRAEVYARVSNAFESRWGLRWLPPLGFGNDYAIAMRRRHADSLGIATLTELAVAAPTLVAGLSPDFMGRADGLDGLAEAYDMRFRDTRSLLQAVKYEALAEGAVDVIDAYSTDGAIARHDLAVLVDDRGFFPPYDAAPLASRAFVDGRPDAALVIARLAGRLDVDRVRRANERIEVEGRSVSDVAAELLAGVGLGGAAGPEAAARDGGGAGRDANRDRADADAERAGAGVADAGAERAGADMADAGAERAGPDRADADAEAAPSRPTRARPSALAALAALPRALWSGRRDLARQTARHLLLVAASLAAAILVAVPAGVALERRRAWAGPAIKFAGLLQTIPGIALLAFMIPAFGIGVAPAVIALFLYSLLPILRNAHTGVVEAAPAAVESGRALGMTEGQILRRVRLPLAAPVIMAGVRTAAVINVGTATLAAFVGAGGLGDPIVAGLSLSDPVMILSGAAPAAALALLVDGLLGRAEAMVAPRGVAG